MYRCNSLISFGGEMNDMLSVSVVSGGKRFCGQTVRTKHSWWTTFDISRRTHTTVYALYVC